MLNGGCWIFLSHYSQDIEKIRMIRNEFERLGHNPLAFHLRCLNADTEAGKKELDSLIKREIDAREWFVFCENPNMHSKWVDMEQAYIIDSGKEMVWSIDMTLDIEEILSKVRQICKDIEVYISYVRADKIAADLLAELLIDKDYSVWTADSRLKPEDNFAEVIGSAIARCAYQGFFIILISESSIKSKWLESELALAINNTGGETIIPIMLGDVILPKNLQNWLNPRYFLPREPTREDFIPVLKEIENTVKSYISGSRNNRI